MKNKLILLLLGGLLGLWAVGCDNTDSVHRHYTKQTQQKVHVYRTHSDNDIASDAWLYYYLFWYNGSCYSYSSPTYYPSSSYNNFNWNRSATAPINVSSGGGSSGGSVGTSGKTPIEEVEEKDVSNQELGKDVDQQIEQQENANESTVEQENAMSNEGNPNNGADSSPTPTPSESNGGESNGGGESSGGDSGGGGGGSGE